MPVSQPPPCPKGAEGVHEPPGVLGGRRGLLPKVEQVVKTKVVTRDTLVTVNA
jgi:hypothetical protein